MRTACARTGVRDVHCIAGRVGSDLIYSAAAWLLVNTCHGCTMRGQLESSRPTDALRRACHDSDLPKQHGFSFSRVQRSGDWLQMG